jgi:hypothetical protein
MKNKCVFSQIMRAAIGVLMVFQVCSVTAAALYDPEPPANSAYLRIIHLNQTTALDVLVDGKLRQKALPSGEAGEYLVLTMGKHTLSLHAIGQKVALVSANIEVESGHAMTVAFLNPKTKAKPLIFEDKTNSNKLKAVLAVYHLSLQSGALDFLTADGKTKVFINLGQGTTQQLAVNPISVELTATVSGSQTPVARTQVEMSAGASYSIIVLKGADGKIMARTTQNKVERYTGK